MEPLFVPAVAAVFGALFLWIAREGVKVLRALSRVIEREMTNGGTSEAPTIKDLLTTNNERLETLASAVVDGDHELAKALRGHDEWARSTVSDLARAVADLTPKVPEGRLPQ